MTNLNVAIFGCSGAIGEALCIEYTKKQNNIDHNDDQRFNTEEHHKQQHKF